MAKSSFQDDDIPVMIQRLNDVYSDDFRHTYSEFFPFIVNLDKESPDSSYQFLLDNLNDVRKQVEKSFIQENNSQYKTLYNRLQKLYDHINLEVSRYDYNTKTENRVKDLVIQNQILQDRVQKTAVELDRARTELYHAKIHLAKAQKAFASSKTDLVTVLSIFTAIAFTFSGGLNYLGSALTGMENAPFFKSAFFALLCGFVLCNVIFLLLYIIGKITDRNIYARCESENCTCKNGKPKCKSLNRVRKRLPYVFWLNIGFLALMLIDLLLWITNNHLHFI